MPVTIDTPRLRLRPPKGGDAAALWDMHRDPDVMQFMTGPPPAVGGVTMAWRNVAMLIGHWHLRDYGQWMVEEKSAGELVGRVGFWNPEGWPGVELGWLIRRSDWGQGLATEAAAAALAWAWRHTSVASIMSLIQPDNVRSIRVAEKIGERFEHTLMVDGQLVQVYVIERPAAAVPA
jgi:RimJ/RimL family protein N-acetyltransferase